MPAELWRRWRQAAGLTDLRDGASVERLWQWAAHHGVVAAGEARRREFFIQAAHAVATATLGPPGYLLAKNVACGLWFASAAEEASGLKLLREMDGLALARTPVEDPGLEEEETRQAALASLQQWRQTAKAGT